MGKKKVSWMNMLDALFTDIEGHEKVLPPLLRDDKEILVCVCVGPNH